MTKVPEPNYDNVPGWKKLELLRNEMESTKDKFRWPIDSKKWFDKEEHEKGLKKLWTAPFDARFPQTNQTRHCWQYYIDYHRCQSLKGEDYEPCEYFKAVYMCMCPNTWIEKFEGWRDNGIFPIDLSQ